ncbi:MAG: 4Fe-4S binding protein [candidate division KSB1 bacterium]|nr:4Fe-4S binding protein [candidate division KSB1 bacterium]
MDSASKELRERKTVRGQRPPGTGAIEPPERSALTKALAILPKRTTPQQRAGRSAARHLQLLRFAVQTTITLLSLWIGLRFYLFVRALEQGGTEIDLSLRSPGVEAYLPIAGLIGLKHWVLSGQLNDVHPAAALFLLGALLTAVLLKKGFCGWICPIGFLSENLRHLSLRLYGRRSWKMPRALDYPLRSLKYLILAFFLWAILAQMNRNVLEEFIQSPYHRVADIKMLKFFTDMSATTAYALLGLLLLSVLVPMSWCRYLCPYGALLGALSWLSPLKIRREEGTCIHCALCVHACPAALPVDQVATVRSDECSGCLECVAACPVPDTLRVAGSRRRLNLRPAVFAALVIMVFFGPVLWGRITGRWRNSIGVEEYRRHVRNLHLPAYQHNRGRVPTPEREP